VTRFRRIVAQVLLVVGIIAGCTAVGEPSTSAEPDASRPPTCVERYPANGPAGVDLRLGCIVSELVGLYTSGQAGPPPTLSTYALVVAGIIALVGVAAWLLARAGVRRASRRMAPVTPSAWWACPNCRSVNGANVERCYACGSPPGDDQLMPTDDRPSTPQSFGERGRRG